MNNEDRGKLMSGRSIALYDCQREFLDMDMEERGLKNFNEYMRWMIDKQMLEKDRMIRIDAALDLGDNDSIRATIGEILKGV